MTLQAFSHRPARPDDVLEEGVRLHPGEHGKIPVRNRRAREARREGLAREVVNRIQRARKQMDLPYEARIRIRYGAEGELTAALGEHVDYVASEVLATELEPRGSEEPAGERHEATVDGAALEFWIETS